MDAKDAAENQLAGVRQTSGLTPEQSKRNQQKAAPGAAAVEGLLTSRSLSSTLSSRTTQFGILATAISVSGDLNHDRFLEE
jgi:hypothetical protein